MERLRAEWSKDVRRNPNNVILPIQRDTPLVPFAWKTDEVINPVSGHPEIFILVKSVLFDMIAGGLGHYLLKFFQERVVNPHLSAG